MVCLHLCRLIISAAALCNRPEFKPPPFDMRVVDCRPLAEPASPEVNNAPTTSGVTTAAGAAAGEAGASANAAEPPAPAAPSAGLNTMDLLLTEEELRAGFGEDSEGGSSSSGGSSAGDAGAHVDDGASESNGRHHAGARHSGQLHGSRGIQSQVASDRRRSSADDQDGDLDEWHDEL